MSKRNRGLDIMFHQVKTQKINSNKGLFFDKQFKILGKILNFKFELFIS
jgi:hypothetical protein